MRRPMAVLVVVSVAALGGCREAAAPPHSNPVIQTAPPQTILADPFALPFPVDAEYLNRVLKALDMAVGDVDRIVVSARTIPPEAITRLNALYADVTFVQIKVNGYLRGLGNGLSVFPKRRRRIADRAATALSTVEGLRRAAAGPEGTPAGLRPAAGNGCLMTG